MHMNNIYLGPFHYFRRENFEIDVPDSLERIFFIFFLIIPMVPSNRRLIAQISYEKIVSEHFI